MARKLPDGTNYCSLHDVEFAAFGRCDCCVRESAVRYQVTDGSSFDSRKERERKELNRALKQELAKHQFAGAVGRLVATGRESSYSLNLMRCLRHNIEWEGPGGVCPECVASRLVAEQQDQIAAAIEQERQRTSIERERRERIERERIDILERLAIRQCYEKFQREGNSAWWPAFKASGSHRVASADWSALLREKVNASKVAAAERERTLVVVDLDW